MKIAKRLFSVMLVAVVAVGLLVAGCGNAQAARAKKTNGSTVILFFSGTGNTRTIARRIQKSTKGKLIQIKASDPYTDADLNYSNEDSRVVKEHESNGGDDKTPLDSSVRPEISNLSAIRKAVKNAKAVYIGYPIWWGNAAWPVNGFVKANDFTGKTVIPFCTSFSSGISSSASNLASMAGGSGNWQSGYRFSQDASESDAQAWVESLGLQKKNN